MTAPLDITDLRVTGPVGRPVVDGIALRLQAGERVGVVGESGAGKTTLALAALGIIRPGLRLAAGRVRLCGQDVFTLPERARRRLRRQHTAWLGQDPAATLTPTMRVANQIGELLEPAERDPAAIGCRLDRVGLPTDAGFLRRLPSELSGGQQQRLALARALTREPRLVVLDEPTSRLDPGTRALVVTELDRLQRQQRFALLVISHDLDLVARLADRVVVLRDGVQVETGDCRPTLRTPAHPYTRRLVDAYPDPRADWPRSAPAADPAVLCVHGLSAGYGHGDVVHDVGFEVRPGEALALVGASGSGKSTLARCLAGLHQPTAGQVRVAGHVLAPAAERRSPEQRGWLQLIPQDPYGSLNPHRRVGAAVARPLRLLHGMSRRQAAARAVELLHRVGLGADLAGRRPGQLSGGERQRAAIARALAARPRVLVCDEITSALDPTVADSIVGLLDELRRDEGVAVVFITHDLGLVRRMADTVAVLEDGHLGEYDTTEAVLSRPRSVAGRALVNAAPSLHATLATALSLEASS
ncbi:ABC transporter ATP-binding protein [Phytohabitans sp. LJ34]|uniref:ABC transporter ATP-binding protein n=1 Tax=Phytohabitans sp. LJ34 TaxID=3452217 RepID=UPI003F8C79D4